MKELINFYLDIIEENCTKLQFEEVETSYTHLKWICEQLLENYEEWPLDKSGRWIGFIQGVLTVYEIMTVYEHRKIVKDSK